LFEPRTDLGIESRFETAQEFSIVAAESLVIAFVNDGVKHPDSGHDRVIGTHRDGICNVWIDDIETDLFGIASAGGAIVALSSIR
jgi:hypothetical protein